MLLGDLYASISKVFSPDCTSHKDLVRSEGGQVHRSQRCSARKIM